MSKEYAHILGETGMEIRGTPCKAYSLIPDTQNNR
jgi:hypothetical protein